MAQTSRTQSSNTDKEMLTMAEEEVARLNRQLRIMDEDKIAFLEEFRLKCHKQKKIIQKLQKERDALNEDMVVVTCMNQCRNDERTASKIENLQNELSKWSNAIKTRKEELQEIEIQIRKPFTLKNDLILCQMCSDRLQESFTFKIMCLNNDNHVKALHNCEDAHPMNLEQLLPNQAFVNDEVKYEGSKICRLCLKQSYSGNFVELRQMDEDIFLKDLISKSFSEMDFSLSLEPVICSLCMESVQNLFNFVIGCFDANEMIKNYISSGKCENIKQIDLVEVLDFMSDLKTSTENDCDLNPIKVEKEEWNIEEIVNEEIGSPESPKEQQLLLKETEKNIKGESVNLFCVERKPVEQNRLYACYHCPYKTTIRATLILHFLVHKSCNEISTFKCDLCNFETKWRTSMRQHLLLHKDKSELIMYKCANCKYQSMFKKHLRRHMQTHNSKKYSCDDCPFITKTLSNFKNHCRDRHGIKKVDSKQDDKTMVKIKNGYKCTHCSYETTKSSRIKEHIVKHLSKKDVPTFQCDLCSFQTKYKASLSHHKKIHQRKDDTKPKEELMP